ncbi:MAG: nickel pincer cofactor biosynthesis protein LarB [Planctomycetes bacterium]|nr:nickel pincer cofactor biosynthesis protein LarB [Planctomycetota bacterium]
MNPDTLRALLREVAAGETSPERALERLKSLPFSDLPFARVDHHRALRCGAPEVIFGEGKTPEQVAAIALAITAREQSLLVTRASPEAAAAVRAELPDVAYDPLGRTLFARRGAAPPPPPLPVLVVSAGTSDLPVAEEARVTAEALGSRVDALRDVGVAGIHRLLAESERLQQAGVVVVVAGMEGALPSVVGGLVSRPVIAVPTSVGYGAAFGGLAALLGMLNSCAPGVTVVNIDNGFGAGYAAAQINRLQAPAP